MSNFQSLFMKSATVSVLVASVHYYVWHENTMCHRLKIKKGLLDSHFLKSVFLFLLFISLAFYLIHDYRYNLFLFIFLNTVSIPLPFQVPVPTPFFSLFLMYTK